MPELVTIARGARAPVLREALGDAVSLLPSRDRARNGRLQAGLLLGWGVPAWYALATFAVIESWRAPLLPLLAVFFLGSLVGPLATTFATAFGLASVLRALQGSRVREALVCPYCRDEVGREGTVACARRSCGAFYHDECWRECSEAYGGCAIYGCPSKRSREVTAAGWLLRMARLGLAALLFPPRAVRALRSGAAGDDAAGRALQVSRRVFALLNSTPLQMALVLVGAPVSLEYLQARGVVHLSWFDVVPALALVITLPAVALAIPYLVVPPVAIALYALGAARRALAGEVSALERADAGGGTVLGRLQAGAGKKP